MIRELHKLSPSTIWKIPPPALPQTPRPAAMNHFNTLVPADPQKPL